MTLTKKKKSIQKEIKDTDIYKLNEAIELSKKFASKNFDESLDMSIVLSVDAKKSDQSVRGVISLPKMFEKKIKIAVFADGDDAKKAQEAGADIVGADDLIGKVKAGNIDFDKCISTPNLMAKVGTLGQVLGPKGLMPNPKLGSVTKDVVGALKKIRSGQMEYKADKAGIVHASVGKVSFTNIELKDNVVFFYKEFQKNKPTNLKGMFIKKIFISSTMGPGLQVDPSSVM